MTLDALESLLAASTPGPITAFEADASLLLTLHREAPKLIAEIRRLRAVLEAIGDMTSHRDCGLMFRSAALEMEKP